MNISNPLSTARPLTVNNSPCLVDPVALVFQGTDLLLAREEGQPVTRIYYTVRNPQAAPGAADEWAPWAVAQLAQPSSSNGDKSADLYPMLRVAGIDLVTVPVPLLPASAPQAIETPFQAVTDQKCITILRVSNQGTLLMDRFVLAGSFERPSNQPQDTGDSSSSMLLQRVVEARYQRSGLRDIPAGPDDSLGTTDMLGNFFYEPTLELTTLPQPPTSGNFAVVLGPSAADGRVWHFFVTTATGVSYASYGSDPTGLPALFPAGPTFLIQPGVTNPTGPDTSETISLTPTGAVGAAVYQEQETFVTTGGTTTLRRGQRLMVAIPVSGLSSNSGLAIYDFQIQPDGTLPILPAGTTVCQLLDGTLSSGVFSPTTGVASFPLPEAAVNVIGASTVYTTLLGQPGPSGPPAVFDSADGTVHCYFAGPPIGSSQGPLQALRYSSLVTRATVPVTYTAGSAQGNVLFTAKRTGTNMQNLWIAVAGLSGAQLPTSPGVVDDLCTLGIAYGTQSGIPDEQWAGLPRDIELLSAIMNGFGSDDPSDPNVQSGAVPFYDFHGIIPQARLPIQDANANTGALAILGHRLDVVLSSIAVVASTSAELATLTFSYAVGGTTPNVTQTWSNVPVAVASATAILAGNASDDFYPYDSTSTDTVIYGLDCGDGTILFFASTASVSSIQVYTADNDDPLLCNILVTSQSGTFKLINVSRQQNDFIAALLGSTSIAGLFLHISPDPVWDGQVPDALVSGPLGLRDTSILFDLLPATIPGASLQAGTVTAAIVQGHVTSGILTAAEALSVSVMELPPPGTTAWIQDTAGTGVGVPSEPPYAAQNGAWLAEPAEQVGQFSSNGYLTVPVDTTSARTLISNGPWTIEAWIQPQVQPSLSQGAMILGYNGPQPTTPGAIQACYFLGLQTRGALQFGPLVGNDASSSYFSISPSTSVSNPGITAFNLPAGDFTIEVWCKITDFLDDSNANTSVVLMAFDGSDNTPIYVFGFNDNVPVLITRASDMPVTNQAETTVPSGVWTHVAVVGQASSVSFYVNGVLSGTATPTMDSTIQGSTLTAQIGAPSDQYFNQVVLNTQPGIFNELRVWTEARSQADIQSTLYHPVDPNTPNLLADWAMIPTSATDTFSYGVWDYGPYAFNAKNQANTDQSIGVSTDSIYLGVFGGIGGSAPTRSGGCIVSGLWSHIAATFAPTGALSLAAPPNGSSKKSYAICKKPSGLSVGDEATFEAWIQLASLPKVPASICAQWGPDGIQQDQAYVFGVASGGLPFCELTLQLTMTNYCQIRMIGTSALSTGAPHHVVATWAQSVDSNGVYWWTGTLYIDGVAQSLTGSATTGDYTATGTTFSYQVPSGGTAIGGAQQTGPAPVVASAAPFTVGICSLPTSKSGGVAAEVQQPFTGLVTGLRVWNIALTAPQVALAMSQLRGFDHSAGVTSAWWFDEQDGQVAADSVGDNLLELSAGNLWSTFAALSTTTIYIDGVPTPPLLPNTTPLSTYYDTSLPQLSIGAYADSTDQPTGFYNGSIAELRVWASERTPVEITSTMFRPLLGNEANLRAYWPLNGTANDASDGGNNASVGGGTVTFVASTAPVGNEPPQVIEVYNGTATSFQQGVQGTPALFELGALNQGRTGLVGAEMFRGMVWSQATLGLTAFTNYGIGSLDLVYLGQVQTQPTLVGYVEGAPPVPSENLSRPLYSSIIGYNAYMDCSAVTLTQQQSDAFTFSRDDEREWGVSTDIKLGKVFSFSSQFLFLQDVALTKAKIGGQIKFDFKFKQLRQKKFVSSWTRSSIDRVGLRGTWEPEQSNPAAYVSPAIGRRYQPENLGYALVESFTSDMYCMQLTGTNTMIARVVVPNTSIGKQRNVIPFQINPYYIKNGTLDGKIGFANDPDYPTADIVRGSYFKPVDASLRSAAILAEEARLQAWADSFNTTHEGKLGHGLDDTDDMQYVKITPSNSAVPRRGIVNTYVWSADGGLHKEEEQFLTSRETTYTGTFTHNNAGGLQMSMDAAAGVGVYGGFDLLETFSIRLSVTKTETQSYSVALAADMIADPFLAAYDAKTQTYSTAPQPGKVDTFRFQSFYLQPAKQNSLDFLDEVVDPVWLHYSSDPGAIALREAKIVGNKPWRILHRVTYVSRVPPAFDTNPAQQVAPAIPVGVDVQDNLLLVGLLQDTIGLSVPSAAVLGSAVTQLLNPETGTPGLAAQVGWWQDFVSSSDGESETLVGTIAAGMMSYLASAYTNQQLPLVQPSTIDMYSFRRGRTPKLHRGKLLRGRSSSSVDPRLEAHMAKRLSSKPSRRTEPQPPQARKKRPLPTEGENGARPQEPST